MLVEWITGGLGVAALAAIIVGVYKALEYFGVKEDSELSDLIEENIERAINNYEDLLTDYIESKGEDIAKENELVGSILNWLNRNTPKILKKYFGTNQQQIEEFIRSYVRGLLNKELDQMFG